MNKRLVILCAGLLAGAAVAADVARACRVVPFGSAAAALAVPLPPLATVKATDASGKTWRQSGEMSGSVEGARREFAMALGAAGWALDKAIVLGQGSTKSELMIWTCRKHRILFMVWEKEPGVSGFAWGQEK